MIVRRDLQKHLSLNSYLACLGAILTICALAVDPFSQQILSYQPCPHDLANSEARIARTNAYYATGFRPTPYDYSAEGTLQRAINVGLVAPAADPSTLTSFRCGSGNCTFPQDAGASFSTLGMCFSCNDISDQIKNVTGALGVNYTLSGGDPPFVDFTNRLQTRLSDIGLSSVAQFTSLHLLNDPKDVPKAFSCPITACVRTYGANITTSVLSERLIYSTIIGHSELYQNQSSGSNQYDPNTRQYILATTRYLKNGSWVPCTRHATNASGLVPVAAGEIDGTSNNTDYRNLEISWFPEECVWSLGVGAANGIVDYLTRVLNDQTWTMIDAEEAIGPLTVERLYNDGTANLSVVSDYMTGLTDAMTANMRQKGPLNETNWAIGSAQSMQTCIVVRWPWLVFLIVLFVLACGFLAALVVVRSKGAEQPLWKSSALAPLLMTVEMQEKMDGFDSQAEMYEVSKEINVMFLEGRSLLLRQATN
jgi:hypothetical protein